MIMCIISNTNIYNQDSRYGKYCFLLIQNKRLDHRSKETNLDCRLQILGIGLWRNHKTEEITYSLDQLDSDYFLDYFLTKELWAQTKFEEYLIRSSHYIAMYWSLFMMDRKQSKRIGIYSDINAKNGMNFA